MEQNSTMANMHGLLECTFVNYANLLRTKYPDKTIRNAAVFDSAIRECSRLGYIELINSKRNMPANLPKRIVQTLKRVRHFPIWIMGPNFPDDPWSMFDQLRPSMQGDEIVWHHHPSRSKPTLARLKAL